MSFNEFSIRHPTFLVDQQLNFQGNDVIVAGGQTTDATPDYRVEPGTVVVKESGDGLYYLADAANDGSHGDRNAAAVVTSLEKPDADWKDKTLTWEVFFPDGTSATGTVVASGADDDTIAEWVTLCNDDPDFQAYLVASDSGAGDLLVVTTLSKGPGIRLRLSMDLDTAYETDDGATSSDEASGSEADYRVVTQHCDLQDLNGTAANSKPVATLLAGHFRESALSNLTNEAKAVLLGRGSRFE